MTHIDTNDSKWDKVNYNLTSDIYLLVQMILGMDNK
jgi:hypothetical protein